MKISRGFCRRRQAQRHIQILVAHRLQQQINRHQPDILAVWFAWISGSLGFARAKARGFVKPGLRLDPCLLPPPPFAIATSDLIALDYFTA